MAEWLDNEVETHVGAIVSLFQALGRKVDLRKVFWANYPVLSLERDQLEEMVRKDTKKLEKEIGCSLSPDQLWYVGVPRFRLIRRGIPHLSCEVSIYYVASDTDWDCWYGKLIPKADKFDIPLALIAPLLETLSRDEVETNEAHILERSSGCTIYEYMGREWEVPNAFLGFAWALAEKGEGFEGLLDPLSRALMDKFTKEIPSPETPQLPTGDDYEAIVTCLKEQMGYPKAKAEEAAKYIVRTFSNESLENKIKYALNYLGG